MKFNSDGILLWLLRTVAVAAGGVLILIFSFLLIESISAFREIGFFRFFSDPSWHPNTNSNTGSYNLVPMILGSFYVMLGAVFLATPLAILSALFCHFYAPAAVAGFYRRIIEVFAGIPSVVYGFWGLVVLVPLIREVQPPGPSLLAGIFILTIMILPTIALMTDAAFSGVPKNYIVAAKALGMRRWTMLRAAIIPASRFGITAGVILGAGRAIGETMAILMVCGNVVQTPRGLFDPIRTLTANIALEMAYATGDHRSALFVSGFILLVAIAAMVMVADLVKADVI